MVNNILFYISGFMIFWAMIGYPLTIKLLGKVYKNKKQKKDYTLEPTVTIMIVAHNEEKVIKDKLDNVCNLNYPKNKLRILVSSDNSTDNTNIIVEDYIRKHADEDITLYKVKDRKGKTNAQNEAQKIVTTEFLVMTDANALLDKDAIRELMASFVSEDILYVTGCLKYINSDKSSTSKSESTYWDGEVIIRDIESRIQTITAGNGALYACRNEDYYDIPPIECHDSSMPFDFALKKKRCLNNIDAIAYEKAGEKDQDEFSRKVRMNRLILKVFKNTLKSMNFFKYKWFSFFYFGHRTCRYLLWINHLLLLVTNIINYDQSTFLEATLLFQIIFYVVGFLSMLLKINNKYCRLIYYYLMTILSQWVAVIRGILGISKPFWEKAESTR